MMYIEPTLAAADNSRSSIKPEWSYRYVKLKAVELCFGRNWFILQGVLLCCVSVADGLWRSVWSVPRLQLRSMEPSHCCPDVAKLPPAGPELGLLQRPVPEVDHWLADNSGCLWVVHIDWQKATVDTDWCSRCYCLHAWVQNVTMCQQLAVCELSLVVFAAL